MYVRTFTLSRQPLEEIIALKKFHRREDRCYYLDDYHFSFNEGKEISISRREYIYVCVYIFTYTYLFYFVLSI